MFLSVRSNHMLFPHFLELLLVFSCSQPSPVSGDNLENKWFRSFRNLVRSSCWMLWIVRIVINSIYWCSKINDKTESVVTDFQELVLVPCTFLSFVIEWKENGRPLFVPWQVRCNGNGDPDSRATPPFSTKSIVCWHVHELWRISTGDLYLSYQTSAHRMGNLHPYHHFLCRKKGIVPSPPWLALGLTILTLQPAL